MNIASMAAIAVADSLEVVSSALVTSGSLTACAMPTKNLVFSSAEKPWNSDRACLSARVG